MRCFIPLVVFVLSILFFGSKVDARRSETPQKRRNIARRTPVFGGTIIKDGAADFAVSIMKNRRFLCTGSLLRFDLVLTAAECVQGQDPADMLVRAGTPVFKNGGQLRKIRQTIFHPNYSEESKSFDVALLELVRPYNASRINISTVNLPEQTEELPTNVIVYGWGINEMGNNTRITKLLRFSKAKILSDRKCSRFLRNIDVDDTVFCTGDRVKRLGICSFSIGSPAMGPDNVQYGILTESGECSDDPPLAVYTNLYAMKDWIENTIKSDLKGSNARNWYE